MYYHFSTLLLFYYYAILVAQYNMYGICVFIVCISIAVQSDKFNNYMHAGGLTSWEEDDTFSLLFLWLQLWQLVTHWLQEVTTQSHLTVCVCVCVCARART